jgi:hypothetical protein
VAQQRDDAVAHEVDGRFETGADQQGGVGREFAMSQLVLGCQAAERIVAGLTRAQLSDMLPKVVVDFAQANDGAAERRPRDSHVEQRGAAYWRRGRIRVG